MFKKPAAAWNSKLLVFLPVLASILLIAALLSGCALPSFDSPTPSPSEAPPRLSSGSLIPDEAYSRDSLISCQFASDTPVMTKDGNKPLDRLQSSDLIMAAGADLQWKPRTLQGLLMSPGQGVKMYAVTTQNGIKVLASGNSSFLTPGKSPVLVKDLVPGSQMLAAGGDTVTLQTVSAASYKGMVIGLSIDGASYLNLNGLAVPEYNFRR